MQNISRDQVKHMMQSDPDIAVVEVLGPESYREYHLPGAINVPVGEQFEENIQQAVPDKHRPVIVYCLDKECQASVKAAQKMDALGYENVYDYEDGKTDWKEAGLAVEKLSSPHRSVQAQ
jgi:rhodanese-related sulfurtransferase